MDEALGTQAAPGDQAVNVRVSIELLVPGVEDGQDARAQAAPGGGFQDRLRDGGEEGVQGLGPPLPSEEERAQRGTG